MFTEQALLFFYCESPMHAGSGASVSYVDLPLQREKHTDYPMVQASGVKGAFRDWAKGLFPGEKDKIIGVFGPPPPPEGDPGDHGGSLSFADAQVLLFPVRSFTGGFAWITCPQVIDRLSRRLIMLGQEGLPYLFPTKAEVLITTCCEVKAPSGQVILEDFAFRANNIHETEVSELANWIQKNTLTPPPTEASKDPLAYLRQRLRDSLLVVHDTIFKDFVRLSTEIVTRIRIGKSGTVEGGALWSQELLPTDTLLYSLALGKDQKCMAKDSMTFLKSIVTKGRVLQMGGDETVGRGLVRVGYYPR